MNSAPILDALFGAANGAVMSGVFKASLVVAVALLLDLGLRRQSAALRHRVWTTVFASLLVLPLAAYVVPAWHLPLVEAPAPASPILDDVVSDRPATAHEPSAALPALASESAPSSGGSGTPADSTRGFVSWGTALAILWVGGATFLLARLALAILSAGRTATRAQDLVGDGWQELAERTRAHLGLVQSVRVAQSAEVDMPMAWGVRAHTVLLPEEADTWSEERREVVLLHEMAHVQRGDCAAQLVSSAAAALHWFNPLVWVARRRQAAERELACDDAVLSSGAAGADYAWHLLEIARASGRPQRFSPAGVMMARKSQLEGRLLAVLDPGRNRREVSRSGSIGVVLGCALLVFPLAGLRPWVAPEAAASELPGSTPAAPAPAISGLPQDDATRERLIGTMIGLLDDEDAGMRSQAAHSLGVMEDGRAVDGLVAALQDDDAAVRSEAVWALGMIESAAAVPGLLPSLQDDDADVRSQTAWALGMIESAEAVPGLVPALHDADAGVRSQTAWALGMIESGEAVAGLVAALQDADEDVRSQVAWALGMIESGDAVPGLVGALQDGDPSVRSQAAWALGMIEDESAVEALIDAVEDENESVRRQALWAISQIMS